METVKVGDKVMWRGSWGSQLPKKATVTRLTLTEFPREKDGVEVNEVPWEFVKENRVVFDLDNGHWAYGSQITRIPQVAVEMFGYRLTVYVKQ